MNYQPVIGLEVHCQLKTKSKLFCACSTEFGLPANSNICPVCTGQPGVLPVLNKKAVEYAIRTAIALNCKTAQQSIFARKNYFYPDLPKNYQISQYEMPLAEDGYLEILNAENAEISRIPRKKRIGIQRVHLEEDAGKLLHAVGSQELDYSLVDFNRTGIPLLEIVSAPEINSPEEAYFYLQTLKMNLQYLDVSDCDMEKGSLRCDGNVSVVAEPSNLELERKVAGSGKKLGVKTEIKNMNSFKALKEALSYEINRQIEVLESGGKIVQETRLWDADRGITQSMRSKEYAHDYRYFPEPDLVPLILSIDHDLREENFVAEIKKNLPELPAQRKERFIKEYQLSEYDAGVVTAEKKLADYYEDTVKKLQVTGFKLQIVAKTIANWITTELLGKLNAEKKAIIDSPIKPEDLAGLIKLIQEGTISGKIAKTVFEEMYNTGKKAEKIVQEKGLVQLTDEKEIAKIIEGVLRENETIVREYKAGKERALGALVGAVMKKTQGRANPQLVNKILEEKLRSC
ncbi:MAG TPA: Asp-tRNA(Asn)/Glu-tRNA(Gln) amidotransferase GatCAB subunit B [Elusimicrobia bacterium]|jgi:aspartyl-tRNA(Asn)/glutamyl-tRNA(Gln) amidotransferase subunit B|nr:Asp-tRNA(Asn)/Glu-tRNA(Gln) amidotransferase GatCAB subunit B [Elusimicrobiota bacterium]